MSLLPVGPEPKPKTPPKSMYLRPFDRANIETIRAHFQATQPYRTVTEMDAIRAALMELAQRIEAEKAAK